MLGDFGVIVILLNTATIMIYYTGIDTIFLCVCWKLKNNNKQTTPAKFNIMLGRLTVDSAGLK